MRMRVESSEHLAGCSSVGFAGVLYAYQDALMSYTPVRIRPIIVRQNNPVVYAVYARTHAVTKFRDSKYYDGPKKRFGK